MRHGLKAEQKIGSEFGVLFPKALMFGVSLHLGHRKPETAAYTVSESALVQALPRGTYFTLRDSKGLGGREFSSDVEPSLIGKKQTPHSLFKFLESSNPSLNKFLLRGSKGKAVRRPFWRVVVDF